MADPMLSALCGICHQHTPKYKCPRCSAQTCSLPCSKKHKIWSACNGVRDPTVYKPRRELATPAGIDHDYNFISAIERDVQRSERAIVEDRNILSQKELDEARQDEVDRYTARRRAAKVNELPLTKALAEAEVTVHKAPKGMARNLENGTSWNKRQRCINWQVEWKIVNEEGRVERVLSKVLESVPLGLGYDEAVELQRRSGLTEEEKNQERKRKADENLAKKEERATKKAKFAEESQAEILSLTSFALLQDPLSCTWSKLLGFKTSSEEITQSLFVPQDRPGTFFYLHKPRTPSSQPPVLAYVPVVSTLKDILRKREVLEFPTIFVLPYPPTDLAKHGFMSEEEYRQRHPEAYEDSEEDTSSSEDSDSSSEESDGDGEGIEEENPEPGVPNKGSALVSGYDSDD